MRTRVCCGNAKLFAWNLDFLSAAVRALTTFGPSRRMNSSTTYCAAWKATTLKAAGIGLHAAQRYAVFGMNQIELANRAHVLREESLKINSWRAAAMEGLLSGPEDQLSAENVADAIALRNEDFSHQHFKTRIVGDRLRVLLIICGLAAIAAAPFIFLPGRIPIVSAVLFFGLLGSAVCSAQSLIAGRSEAAASNLFITLTPVLFGALAGLGGYAAYEYMPSLTFHSGDRHISAVMGLAFLFGCLGQRLLAHLGSGRKREKRPAPRSDLRQLVRDAARNLLHLFQRRSILKHRGLQREICFSLACQNSANTNLPLFSVPIEPGFVADPTQLGDVLLSGLEPTYVFRIFPFLVFFLD